MCTRKARKQETGQTGYSLPPISSEEIQYDDGTVEKDNDDSYNDVASDNSIIQGYKQHFKTVSEYHHKLTIPHIRKTGRICEPASTNSSVH